MGDYADLILDDQIVGAVLRTKKNVKPVFISPGHKIGIGKAVEVVLSCCRGYKLPEPTRRAHLLVNQLRLKELSSC
jgi:deoxyribonuclease V